MIRVYQPSDLAAIEEIGEQVIQSPNQFPYEDLAGVTDYWFSNPSNCCVYEDHGQVLGSYVLKPNVADRGNHIANAGYMVHQSAKGKGIGRKLALHSIDFAKKQRYLGIQFNVVVETNTPAINLWKSVGFSIIGTIPGAFRVGPGDYVDLHVMYKKL